MQFYLKGHDGTDAEAPARRTAARPAHLALAEKMKSTGNLLMAAAIKSESGQMIGSVMVFDFPDRLEFDKYLESEPYMLSGVWKELEIQEVAVSPIFLPQTAANS